MGIRTKLSIALIVALAAGPWIYERSGLSSLFVDGGFSIWIPVDQDHPFISRSVALALAPFPPKATPGDVTWQSLEPGFDVAELPAFVNGAEVERLFLARIDPARFRFEVALDPTGRRTLGGWMRATGALLAVNGSYFGPDGAPTTPVVSDGKPYGPHGYDARHGAFVAAGASAFLVDLAEQDWKEALQGSEAAMVSYPLLLSRSGGSRVPADRGWLATRSFLGEDAQGRILIGTSKDGFFTLARLAEFLKAAPLDLRIALNLDGGPVGCQAVALGTYRRDHCGLWELQVEEGQAKMIAPLSFLGRSPLPIALLVKRRTDPMDASSD